VFGNYTPSDSGSENEGYMSPGGTTKIPKAAFKPAPVRLVNLQVNYNSEKTVKTNSVELTA